MLEFVIVPVCLSNERMLDRMLLGHFHQNTMGVHTNSLPKMTPQMPWLDASTIPMKFGHPHVNLRHLVGAHIDSQREGMASLKCIKKHDVSVEKDIGRLYFEDPITRQQQPNPPPRDASERMA